MTKIGVVGAGRIGAGVGTLLAAAGHDVMFSFSRDPERLQQLARSVGPMARAGSPAEANAFADIILLAPPYWTLNLALEQVGPMNGKVVIDATNPFTPDFRSIDFGSAGSAGEALAAAVPGARVVKAFNTLPAEVYGSPDRRARLVLFLCGDDQDARQMVAALIGDAGFAPVDVGPLSQARLQEPGGSRYNTLLTETADL